MNMHSRMEKIVNISYPSCPGVWNRKDVRETMEWRKNNRKNLFSNHNQRRKMQKNKFQLRTTKSDKLKNVM